MELPAELSLDWPGGDPSGEHARLLDRLPQAIYITDRTRRMVQWNQAASRLAGFDRQEVLGRCCANNVLMHVDDSGTVLCKSACPLSRTLADGQPRQAAVYLRHKLGHRVPVSVLVCPLHDAKGDIAGAMEIFEASGNQLVLEQASDGGETQAVDALTQTASRHRVTEMLAHLAENFATRSNSFSVLLIDIDRLTQVNQEHGRETGDLVIQGVARSLAACLRSSDTLGRWLGDVFLAILPGITEKYSADIAERCRAMVEQTAVLAGEQRVPVTVSIALARATPGMELSGLLVRAQELLVRGKEAGGNRVNAGK